MTVLLNTPASVQLEHLASFLEASMEKRVSQRHNTQLLRGLMHSQYLQVQEERIRVESQKVTLSEMDSCPVCLKKFRNQGTLVRFPNGRVVHYSCQEKAMMVSWSLQFSTWNFFCCVLDRLSSRAAALVRVGQSERDVSQLERAWNSFSPVGFSCFRLPKILQKRMSESRRDYD